MDGKGGGWVGDRFCVSKKESAIRRTRTEPDPRQPLCEPLGEAHLGGRRRESPTRKPNLRQMWHQCQDRGIAGGRAASGRNPHPSAFTTHPLPKPPPIPRPPLPTSCSLGPSQGRVQGRGFEELKEGKKGEVISLLLSNWLPACLLYICPPLGLHRVCGVRLGLQLLR